MSYSASTIESSLVLRAQSKKDDNAFARLVKMHQSKVRSFLLRLCRQTDLADDLAQEVFIIAFQRLETYRGSGEFSGWLCSIAYRCFLKHCQRTKRESDIYVQYADNTEVLSNRLLENQFENLTADQLALEQAMQQLSDVQSASITLCESFGFSHSEAAAILDLPLGTVKSHVNRGKQKLRELLLPREE